MELLILVAVLLGYGLIRSLFLLVWRTRVVAKQKPPG